MRVGGCRQLRASSPRSPERKQRLFWRDTKTNTRGTCAPRSLGQRGNRYDDRKSLFRFRWLVKEAAECCRFGNHGAAISPPPPNMVVGEELPTPNCIDLPCERLLAIIFTTTRRSGRHPP